jgi:hypothetical protein
MFYQARNNHPVGVSLHDSISLGSQEIETGKSVNGVRTLLQKQQVLGNNVN